MTSDYSHKLAKMILIRALLQKFNNEHKQIFSYGDIIRLLKYQPRHIAKMLETFVVNIDPLDSEDLNLYNWGRILTIKFKNKTSELSLFLQKDHE